MVSAVELCPSEVLSIESIALVHMHFAAKYGYRHGYGYAPTPEVELANRKNALAAEYVVAKSAATFWRGLIVTPDSRDMRDRDVIGWQVRWTANRSGSLILYAGDADDARFVLVTGALPTFEVAGWIVARDGKRPAYWRADARYPTWFVPQSALEPFTADGWYGP